MADWQEIARPANAASFTLDCLFQVRITQAPLFSVPHET
jgi:hypothetical protein